MKTSPRIFIKSRDTMKEFRRKYPRIHRVRVGMCREFRDYTSAGHRCRVRKLMSIGRTIPDSLSRASAH